MKHRLISILNFFAILMLSLTLAACGGEDQKPKAQEIKPVKVITVGKPTAYVLRSFPGKVKAFKEAKLSFQVPGQLIALPVREGQRMKKGELIARLDPKKFQDKVHAAEAKYLQAKADYQRAAKLVKGDFISKAEYDAKQAEYKVARSRLETAKKNLQDTYIYAPFDGFIAVKHVDNYEQIKAKEPIVNFHDISKVDVVINVPESIMLHLREDSKSSDHEPAYAVFDSAPDKKFKVKFKEFSSDADPETQTYRVAFTMNEPQGINIFPGMSVTIKVQLHDFKSGGEKFFILPSGAVFSGNDNKTYVWVIDPQTKIIKKTEVKVSRLADNNVRVLSGVKPGDMVVAAGAHYLREGDKVRPVKSTEVR